MKELSYENYIPDRFLKDFKEELWVDKQMVREAWCTELPEAQPIIEDLISAFPEITVEYLKSNKSNMIGYASNYRPPYTNGCVSWYTWDYPTNQDYSEYNIAIPDGCSIHRWFGKKYDISTKQTWLKYVFKGVIPTPPLPNSKKPPFYAMISDQQKNVLPIVDVYFNSTDAEFKEYCDQYGLNYPAPESISKYEDRRLWAVVYDINTLEISKVKAYDIFDFKKRASAHT